MGSSGLPNDAQFVGPLSSFQSRYSLLTPPPPPTRAVPGMGRVGVFSHPRPAHLSVEKIQSGVPNAPALIDRLYSLPALSAAGATMLLSSRSRTVQSYTP